MKTKIEIEVERWIEQRKERGYKTFDKICWQISFSYGPEPRFFTSRYGAPTPKDAVKMFKDDANAEIRDHLRRINSYMNELQMDRDNIARVAKLQIPKGYK